MSTSTTTAGPAIVAGPAPARRRSASWRKRVEIALFAGPALVVYIAFVLLPVVLAAVYSFFKWNGYGRLTEFIGIDNYVRALGDPLLHAGVGRAELRRRIERGLDPWRPSVTRTRRLDISWFGRLALRGGHAEALRPC